MASGNIKGITIEFKGDTTNLGKALSDIKSKASGVDKSLREVNNALKFNKGNSELIAQKQQLLKQKVDQTKSSLEALKAAQKTLDAKGVDKSSQEYTELRREIITTESKLKHFNEELKKVGSAKLNALGDQFSSIGSKMTSVGKSMSTYVTAPVVAGFSYAAKAASDYEENVNKVQVAFGDSSQAVMDFANTATSQFGLSKNSALEMTSLFGDMGTSMGLSQSSAADMSIGLAGLAGDLASFKNIGVDEAMTALKGVFTGETESLKNLGVVMTQDNLKQFAADQGLVYNSMSQSEKATLRYNYVLSQTKNAQDDYANTSDGTANSARTFTESLNNLSVTFGQYILPVITPVIQKLTELVQKFGEMDPKTQKIIVIIAAVAAAIGPLLVVIGSIASAVGAIMALPFAASILPIVGIIAAVVAVGILLYKNWDKIKAKAVEIGASISKTFQSMKAKIVAIFNSIKSTVSSIWNGIKTAITSPINTAANLIRSAINKIKSIINGAKLQLPHFKLPHFNISGGKAPWGLGGEGTKPSISVDWYKTGGIFSSPSIIGVGEAGTEAVAPIDKLQKYIRDAVGSGGGNTWNITMHVSGAENPEEWATRFARSLQRQARMGV